MDDASVDAQAMKPIVEAFPQAKILMRVFDRRQLLALDGSGVDGVIREVFESSIAMGLTALRHLDVDPSEMEDRKSVGSGKSVSVRVDHGGRRIIKKNNERKSLGKHTYANIR